MLYVLNENLSAMLSVPLVLQLPQLAAPAGTKLMSKRIFAAADVNALPSIYDLFDLSLLLSAIARLVSRLQRSMCVVVKLDEEVKKWINALCKEGGEVGKKALEVDGQRIIDVVLLSAAIELEVLEEGEKAEERERGGKEGEEDGKVN
ncbi:uncharacterized protein MONOS_14677 [Monocercomonoides exilis]|uniref:uncharacterized protein n=1 Tax=Monocercomonoides exilis TaxID=2049356 RepID=UPI0035598954|nr:hypothetical protein MONOS_14677 [Monocercomonoides exilis]|eukprot:MONOS_14677.1-p1 / transcript=MONOS_14677.1 / gene=MONOS_14677 / organism=Monocercomonoides_exilis_PA203 / gene_product=unspecified product / transcript_product=unspecified product / location=Mono_scaffold01048:2027-2470(-) / protein_length=148 / sequence_SO=supercontig / SO=protein_coding / is_pseudo=false